MEELPRQAAARRKPVTFGYGDGGGGPTEEMLERTRLFADFPAVPALRQVAVEDWYAGLHDAIGGDPDVPVWVGEIYLELHRGTLTSQGRAKYLHRRAERALITAETLYEHGDPARGDPVAPSLEEQWRILLRNEFHDILPGLERPRGLPTRGNPSSPRSSRTARP